jgi:hypothetical protein
MQEARKQVASYALFRPESAVIIALTIFGTGLALFDLLLPHAWWWVVLLLGVAATIILLLTTLRDKKFLGQISSRLFYDRFDTRTLDTPELRRSVLKALEFHRDVFKTIRSRPAAPLGQIALTMDEWVIHVYNVANQVDTFVRDPYVVDRLNRLADISGGELFNADGQRNMSLMISEQQREEPVENEYGLLAEVKKAVLGATHELDISLAGMYQVHEQLKTVHPTDLDRIFAEQMHDMMSAHMTRLDRAGGLVEELFSTYARPIQELTMGAEDGDDPRIAMVEQD